jgi:hypothetical protein
MGADCKLTDIEKICLIILFKIEIAEIDYELDIDEISKKEINPEDIAIRRDIIEKMSEDAQQVLEIICSNPRLVDIFCHAGRLNQRNFLKYMISKGYLNWTLTHTHKVFQEVKQALKEMIT